MPLFSFNWPNALQHFSHARPVKIHATVTDYFSLNTNEKDNENKRST